MGGGSTSVNPMDWELCSIYYWEKFTYTWTCTIQIHVEDSTECVYMYVCVYIYILIQSHTMKRYSSKERKEALPYCHNIDGPQKHYAKWNKSNRKWWIPHDLICTWNLANKTRNKFIIQRTDWWFQGLRMGKMDDQDQKTQTSSCNINKSWRYNLQHADYS